MPRLGDYGRLCPRPLEETQAGSEESQARPAFLRRERAAVSVDADPCKARHRRLRDWPLRRCVGGTMMPDQSSK